ncbi:MAG: amino acid--tRNA ligase-related protein [Turneriella sp.]
MKAQLLRNEAIRQTRNFFSKQNIVEVRTTKVVQAGAMEPYIDAIYATGQFITPPLPLATSPEMAMKKAFAAEIAATPKAAGIYEIAPVFRDDRPGKNHAAEFTMIEWYLRDCDLPQILQSAANLITLIAEVCAAPCDNTLRQYSLPELFSHAGYPYDYHENKGFSRWYLELHKSLPFHLNELDLEIAAFNLLFDELVLPQLKAEPGLCAVFGYPDMLAAMAYSENGIATRAEIYWHGIEMANGYREEYRPEVLRTRWQSYNKVRELRKVNIHPIDEELLTASSNMKNVSGIALGLERVLAAFLPDTALTDF